MQGPAYYDFTTNYCNLRNHNHNHDHDHNHIHTHINHINHDNDNGGQGPAYYDFTTNYCNLRNLITGSGLADLDGYRYYNDYDHTALVSLSFKT